MLCVTYGENLGATSVSVRFRPLSSTFENDQLFARQCHQHVFHHYHLILKYKLFSTCSENFGKLESPLWEFAIGTQVSNCVVETGLLKMEDVESGTMAFSSRWIG